MTTDAELADEIERRVLSSLSVTPPLYFDKAEWREIIAALRRSEPSQELSEEQRQMVLLAIAELSLRRPGWDWTLGELATTLNGREMFDGFKKISEQPSSDQVLVPESALHAVWLRHPLAIAELCDEHVDRGGALLGRVRLAAAEAEGHHE